MCNSSVTRKDVKDKSKDRDRDKSVTPKKGKVTYASKEPEILTTGEDSEEEFDDDFECSDEEAMQDDETTLIEAEAMNDEQDNASEIDKLQQESEIPVEQLRAMYAGLQDMSDSEGDDGDDDDDDAEDVEDAKDVEEEGDAKDVMSLEGDVKVEDNIFDEGKSTGDITSMVMMTLRMPY